MSPLSHDPIREIAAEARLHTVRLQFQGAGKEREQAASIAWQGSHLSTYQAVYTMLVTFVAGLLIGAML